MKVLFIQTAFLGDLILATSLIETLAHYRPEAEIHVLCRQDTAGLLANNPHVQQVLIWDKTRKWSSWWSVLKRVRLEAYDHVINVQRFFAMGLLCLLSKAGERVGFDKNPCSWAFHRRLPHRLDLGWHETERNFQLLAHLLPQGAKPLAPRLYPSDLSPEKRGLKPYVCLAPSSIWATKTLPQAQWLKLMEALPKDFKLYLLGSPADKAACELLRAGFSEPERVYNAAGSYQLLESAALMEGAEMNYVNDSGPLHLASARNAPVVAFFCSTSPSFGFGPLSQRSWVVENKDLACKPCGLHGKRVCPLGHFRCGHDLVLPSWPLEA